MPLTTPPIMSAPSVLLKITPWNADSGMAEDAIVRKGLRLDEQESRLKCRACTNFQSLLGDEV